MTIQLLAYSQSYCINIYCIKPVLNEELLKINKLGHKNYSLKSCINNYNNEFISVRHNLQCTIYTSIHRYIFCIYIIKIMIWRKINFLINKFLFIYIFIISTNIPLSCHVMYGFNKY